MSGFVLGFGSTEKAFEDAEERAIGEYITERFQATDDGYFSDELIADITKWIKARADDLHAQSKVHKKAAEYPSRYSEYWPTVLSDASHIAVVMSVHHINRRHAMSPDGWAVMQTRPVFVFRSLDIPMRSEVA